MGFVFFWIDRDLSLFMWFSTSWRHQLFFLGRSFLFILHIGTKMERKEVRLSLLILVLKKDKMQRAIPFHLVGEVRLFLSRKETIPHSLLDTFPFHPVYERQYEKGQSSLSIFDVRPRWRGAFPFEPSTLDQPFSSGLWKTRWKGKILPFHLVRERKMERSFSIWTFYPGPSLQIHNLVRMYLLDNSPNTTKSPFGIDIPPRSFTNVQQVSPLGTPFTSLPSYT